MFHRSCLSIVFLHAAIAPQSWLSLDVYKCDQAPGGKASKLQASVLNMSLFRGIEVLNGILLNPCTCMCDHGSRHESLAHKTKGPAG